MNKSHNIKRGVSLYSYQEEFFLRKMTLENCIATSSAIGANGIEIISEQMLPGFPNYSDEFYRGWHELLAKYGAIPICHDMFLDTRLHKHRLLTEEECVASLFKDIVHASKLGCEVIRILVVTPPSIVEKCAPIAEEYGVKLCVEIHSPWSFEDPWILQHFDVIQKVNSKHLGFIPDMGIFVKRFPQIILDRFLRDGAQQNLVSYMREAYNSHTGLDTITDDVKLMGGNNTDIKLAELMKRYIYADPKCLKEYMSYIPHIHAKFYDMQEDYHEPSIPYEEIIPILIEGGYNGYLSSEYEGNRHIQDAFEVNSVEQVRRQQEMFKRLLDLTEEGGGKSV